MRIVQAYSQISKFTLSYLESGSVAKIYIYSESGVEIKIKKRSQQACVFINYSFINIL